MSSREQILQNIRSALSSKNKIDMTPLLEEEQQLQQQKAAMDDLAVYFAQQFTQIGGSMSYCATQGELYQEIDNIHTALGKPIIGCSNEAVSQFVAHHGIQNAEAAKPEEQYTLGVSICESLVADGGLIILSSRLGLDTSFKVLPQNLIVIAFTSQVVATWDDFTERLLQQSQTLPSSIVAVTPASLDGRTRLHLILIDDQ